jgi:hypothetical protein
MTPSKVTPRAFDAQCNGSGSLYYEPVPNGSMTVLEDVISKSDPTKYAGIIRRHLTMYSKLFISNAFAWTDRLQAIQVRHVMLTFLILELPYVLKLAWRPCRKSLRILEIQSPDSAHEVTRFSVVPNLRRSMLKER